MIKFKNAWNYLLIMIFIYDNLKVVLSEYLRNEVTMIENNPNEDHNPSEVLKIQANALQLLSGLGITLLKNNRVWEVYGDKNVQAFMHILGDNFLFKKTFEQAISAQQVSILSLGNLAEILYLPLPENWAWLIGPYRTQSSKCPMNDPYYQSLKDEERQELIQLCNRYPLKGDMEIDAFLRIALTTVQSPLVETPAKVKFVDSPYSADFPPSEINRTMIKPIFASIQEQENPNVILMIRDFIVDGNAKKGIEIYQKSIQQIPRPLTQKIDSNRDDIAHRLGILYSIFYKMLESTADPAPLIRIKNKYIEQFQNSKCTQELDLMTMDMLSGFASQAQVHLQIESYADLIQKAILYIHEHAKSKISLKDIANSLHVNACYLSSIFKKETGKPITIFIAELKMADAKELLENTNLAVTDICYQVGYDNPSYFTEVFKKTVGMTPKEYKANYKLDKYTP